MGLFERGGGHGLVACPYAFSGGSGSERPVGSIGEDRHALGAVWAGPLCRRARSACLFLTSPEVHLSIGERAPRAPAPRMIRATSSCREAIASRAGGSPFAIYAGRRADLLRSGSTARAFRMTPHALPRRRSRAEHHLFPINQLPDDPGAGSWPAKASPRLALTPEAAHPLAHPATADPPIRRVSAFRLLSRYLTPCDRTAFPGAPRRASGRTRVVCPSCGVDLGADRSSA